MKRLCFFVFRRFNISFSTFSYPFHLPVHNAALKYLLALSSFVFFFGSMYVVACVKLTQSAYSHPHRMPLMICRSTILSISYSVIRYRQSDVSFFSAHFVHIDFFFHIPKFCCFLNLVLLVLYNLIDKLRVIHFQLAAIWRGKRI